MKALRISRRNFVAAILLCPLSSVARINDLSQARSLPLEHLESLHKLINTQIPIYVIGHAYLHDHAMEAEFELLKSQTLTSLGLDEESVVGMDEIQERFFVQTQLDFERDDIEKVCKYWLPITELRICALTAIIIDEGTVRSLGDGKS